MNPDFFSFDYDYVKESWNLPRGSVPAQLKTQGVPQALWMHFWDYAQSVVERVAVRSIMKKKLQKELNNYTKNHTSNNSNKAAGLLSKYQTQERKAEIAKLNEQTSRDFDCLKRQAERLFPNIKARVSQDAHSGKQVGLEIQMLHPSHHEYSSSVSSTVHLHYDDRTASWNLPRDILPTELADHGVPLADWTAIWDYGFGVNQRAKEREHLNELHERELQLCHKSLSYMNSTHIASVDQNAASSHNSTANHIRTKMDKLRRAQEANTNNTHKGWQELQRRAAQRFEPYGVKVYLSRQEEQICCGLRFQCPNSRNKMTTTHSRHNKVLPTSSVWLPSSSSPHREIPPQHKDEQPFGVPISSVWRISTTSNHGRSKPRPDSAPLSSSSSSNVLRPSGQQPKEKENAPPKPEDLRKATRDSVWGHPVVLTYVHDEIPTRIEVTTPLSADEGDDPFVDSYEEDSHGYVVPPAPSDPPSSIGSSSSSSSEHGYTTNKKHANKPISASANKKKKVKRVRFGNNRLHQYENPYTKDDRKTLWFTHEDREACRSRTKILAQRVIDNRGKGGSHNVVFMDSETEEEVCWRGLEHAKKGNLSSRQETRRSFLTKVLEKQRSLRFDSFTSRRGTVADPQGELQQYAARQSRHCRDRAQKLAAQDAKEARAVYKESLRKINLYTTSGGLSLSSSTCSSQHGRSMDQGHSHHHLHHHQSQRSRHHANENDIYHQNDIFQDYCRQMHLASKARLQQAVM